MTARDLLTEAAERSPRVRAWCRWTGARTEADLERCTPQALAELSAILADPDSAILDWRAHACRTCLLPAELRHG